MTERATAGHDTQICWGGSVTAAAAGDNSVAWPVAFANSDYAVCFIGTTTTWNPAYIISKATVYAHLYLRVSGYVYNVIAVGRWK